MSVDPPLTAQVETIILTNKRQKIIPDYIWQKNILKKLKNNRKRKVRPVCLHKCHYSFLQNCEVMQGFNTLRTGDADLSF